MKSLVSAKKKKVGLVKKAGFTLIELIVVLGIFALIMSVALFNQASLSSNVLITNLAYETALAVREAQTYGISVKATASSTLDSNFDMGYGAYFDISKSDQMVVFGDADGNKTYTENRNPTELQYLYKVQNQRGNRITAICVANGTAPGVPCHTGVNSYSVNKLAIMFKRPNPESVFNVVDDASGVSQYTGPAVIVVNNIDNSNCRAIVVEATGQIRVENSTGGNCTNDGVTH